MIAAAIQRLRSPTWGIGSVLSVFLVVPVIFASAYGDGILQTSMVFIGLVAAFILTAEVSFRLGYRLYVGSPYLLIPRLSVEKIFVEPHPYLPFVNKRHVQTLKGGPDKYALHSGQFSFGQYSTNNMRFVNGPDGTRDVVVPKPDGMFRVSCIGASATANYIEHDGRVFSYPMELENILESALGVPLEVNNCGQGGYNTADMFVRFSLQVIDTQPDVVVIYHAYSDIRAYLTVGFESDYSHARRNLGETYWKFGLAAKIPDVPFKFLNYLVNQWLPVNSRNSVIEQVSKGNVNPELDPSPGLRTYQRNLQHIIDLCRSNGIHVVLSTYCHFLYSEIKDDPLHQLYARVLGAENDVMRLLAKKNGLKLADNAVLIPHDERYFVDSTHFTPAGMRLVASNIAQAIQELALGIRSKS